MNVTRLTAGSLAPLLAAAALASQGCASLQPGTSSLSLGSFGAYDIDAVPARRLPPPVLGRPKADLIETSKARLRQRPPEVYVLDAGDVLGVFIEGVLGEAGEAPPVQFPEDASIPPSLGFPVPVRDDGTVSLPLVRPVDVQGLTVSQAEDKIRQAYIDEEILVDPLLKNTPLPPGDFVDDGDGEGAETKTPPAAKTIVSLIRQREYRVLVIREEAGGAIRTGPTRGGDPKRGTGSLVDLKAYENDLLTALSVTGGLPGTDAKNEVVIFRGGGEGSAEYDAAVAAFRRQPVGCGCKPPLPDPYGPNAVRIPLRFFPEFPPTFTEEDITLYDGDIVYIPARDSEKFYTGGELGGGEYLLPRDYDLNILQAVGLAGGSVGSGSTGIGSIQIGGFGQGGGGRGGGALPPSRAIVIRQLPNDCGEIAIRVDLTRALTDSSERILIQPEDVIIVQYTICEEIANLALRLVPFAILRGAF